EEMRRQHIEDGDYEDTRREQDGQSLREHQLLREYNIVLSRMLRGDLLSVPTADTQVRLGDIFRAVGKRTHVQRIIEAMGRRSEKNLGEVSGDVQRVELVVTRPQVLRKSLRELDYIRRAGVTIARITRAR